MKRFIVASLLILSACGTTLPPSPQSPQQAVYLIKGDYAAALSVAVQYRSLPVCPAPAPCAENAVVAQIQQIDNVAYLAIDAAEKAVRDPAADGTVTQQAILAAQGALDTLLQITATLKVK